MDIDNNTQSAMNEQAAFDLAAAHDAIFAAANQDLNVVAAAGICNGMPMAEIRERILRVALA